MNLTLALLLLSLGLVSAVAIREAGAVSLPLLFNSNSIWNQKIQTGVSASSVGLSGLPVYLIGISADGSSPVYVANSSTPIVTVTDSSGNTMHVPVESSWLPDPGSDGKISIVGGSRTYCMYKFSGTKAGAIAWGDLSTAGDGIAVYRDNGPAFGCRAAGLTYLAGLITHDELAAGYIPHALAISLPRRLVSSSFVWPAKSSDGYGGSIPMGARLQLDPSVPMPTDPAARAIYQALKDYGAWVVDVTAHNLSTGSVQFHVEARITSSGAVDSSYYSGIASTTTVSGLPLGSLRRVSVNQSGFYVNSTQPSCLTCVEPLPTPTATHSPTRSPAPIASPNPTATPTANPAPSPTSSPTAIPTPNPAPSPSQSPARTLFFPTLSFGPATLLGMTP